MPSLKSSVGVWLPPLLCCAAGIEMSACAAPCVDDGINQGDCPAVVATGTASSGAGTGDTLMDGDASASATAGETATDGASGTATVGSMLCPDLQVTLLPSTPTMHIVVDRSGSMSNSFGDVTRWQAVVDTLVHPQRGVVTARQSEIRFGLSLYANDGVDQCPDLINFGAQLDAADEIEAVFAQTAPGGATPTGESLRAVTPFVLADPWEGERFMVLATDGEPDLCGTPDPTTPEEIAMARGAVVDAVAAAFEDGIRTFVISVGTRVAEAHLQDIANAGVGNGASDPDALFYRALDPDALISAFDSIIGGARQCQFDLDEPVTPQLAGTCSLIVNGARLAYENPDGWRLANERRIALEGDACAGIQRGVVQIDLSCPCDR